MNDILVRRDEDSAFAGALDPTDAEPGKYLEWTGRCV
jgi:hypothetical protein